MNPSGKPPQNPSRMKRIARSRLPRYVLGSIVSIFVFLGVSFRKAFELMGRHDTHVARQAEDHRTMAGHAIGTEPLEHESMFIDTLKSCLPAEGDKSCNTFVPGDGTTERIGILAPPGTTTDALLKLVSFLVKVGKKEEAGKVTKLEVIPTTHIAPYGYGKTHGWTRLIRVVPQPLLVGATDTLHGSILGGNETITLNEVKAALRQQIRYHCRLNHIAAHTAIWTVGLEDVSAMPLEDMIDNVKTFFAMEEEEDAIDNLLAHYATIQGGDTSQAKLDVMYAKGASLLSLIQSQTEGNVLKMLDDVLLDEMKISKNLTAWPCESFWTVGEPQDRLSISPIIQRIAKAMSPQCDAPFTSCFVKRDKCEFKGDGACS